MKLVNLDGQPCFWCRRPMSSRGESPPKKSQADGLLATRDHYVPKSAGGRRCVFSCKACNQVRGNMPVRMWRTFCARVPEWWRLFEVKGPRGKALFYADAQNADLRKWEDRLFPASESEMADG